MGILYSRSIGALSSKGKYIFSLDNDDMFLDFDVFSTITNIAAAVFGIFVGWKLTTSMCDTAEGLVNISSRVFDVIVNTWREIAWPRLKMFYENVSEWICSLKERGRITQDNVNEVDLNVAPVTV